jgi:hypothetical protein
MCAPRASSGGQGAYAGEVPLEPGAEVTLHVDLKPGANLKLRTEDWGGVAVPGVEVSYANALGKGGTFSVAEALSLSGPRFEKAWCRTDDKGEGEVMVYDVPGVDLKSALVCTFPAGRMLRLERPEAYAKHGLLTLRAPIKDVVMGRVIDAAAGSPLGGVAVRADFQGGREVSAQTDGNGWFQLPAENGAAGTRVRVLKGGYAPQEFTAGKDVFLLRALER